MSSIERGLHATPSGFYPDKVAGILDALGVPAGYGAARGLPLFEEAVRLVSVGLDVFGREQFLAADVAERWASLVAAAARDGVELHLVSGFRSLDYQRGIFERKLAAGTTLDDILQVNAPPGYSEHHTGRAVDITTPGLPPLTEAFESSEAFAWLARSAAQHGLRMSYPRGNTAGVVYEPWHWYFSSGDSHP